MNEQLPQPPPSRLSNLECLAILTDSRLVARLADSQKRALLRAVHALARREMQKERNMRNRDKGAYRTPDAVLANPPFAPATAPETTPATETEAANE
jgi:hypothetical protein